LKGLFFGFKGCSSTDGQSHSIAKKKGKKGEKKKTILAKTYGKISVCVGHFGILMQNEKYNT
jgi:hypothetical protein